MLLSPITLAFFTDREPRILASKSKKARKKKGGTKDKTPPESGHVNGVSAETKDDAGSDTAEPETPVDSSHQHHEAHPPTSKPRTAPAVNGAPSLGIEDKIEDLHVNNVDANLQSASNARSRRSTATEPIAEAPVSKETATDDGTGARLEAMAKERSALRDEVRQLRQSLEELQGKHEEELQSMRGQLDDSREEKDNAETQYRNLLGKVNTIKSQLGERLKADAVCVPPVRP